MSPNVFHPLVTVVIPSFNEDPRVVRASFDSIRNQSLSDFECIVVDDSSDLDLAAACQSICMEDPRFFYVRPTVRLGLPRSLNLAISKARGDFIARFDADDIAAPDRLELQTNFLKTNPNISIVGGAMGIMNDDCVVFAYRHYPEGTTEIARGMQVTTTIAHPTVMFRKDAVMQHGGYDPAFRYSEDLDLWLRWINSGLFFANLPNVLVHYRQNNTARSRQHWKYNLKARMKNFRSKHFPLRMIGIIIVGIWLFFPVFVQERVFKIVLFR